MKNPIHKNSIVTVGICPCWDRTCSVDGIQWNQHKKISSQTCVPAGKALNISAALNRLQIPSIAAGLWGKSDYRQMLEYLAAENPFVQPHFTVADGRTRTNITVVDTRQNKELHLRAPCTLATEDSLRQLKNDLQTMTSASTVVFAGSMSDDLLNQIISIMDLFRESGTKRILDTSGSALKTILKQQKLYLIKPNLEELGWLLDSEIASDVSSIIRAARSLCDRAQIILVSRGADGALLVTKEQAIECKVKNQKPVINTVGCGDYLLAGFLSRVDSGDLSKALTVGVKTATARAWGIPTTADWKHQIESIDTELTFH